MADLNNLGSAGQAGSPGIFTAGPAAAAGEPGLDAASLSALQAQYEEAQKKLGTQGQELGELRTFFKNIEPLLEKLDTQPEVIKAILDGKIDVGLAKAALEGKIKIEDAAVVSAAHDQVQKELGKKKYEGASPEDIAKLVEEKAAGIKEELTRSFNEREELKTFEEKTAYFIANTSDFEKYANDVNTWLQDNPDQDNIEVAYYAVKGKALEKALEEGNESALAELRKEMALNAGGGSSQGGSITVDQNVVDSLISRGSAPNRL
jgi:hypothetical protein